MDAKDSSAFAVLAAKVDELSQVCTQLSRENAELRDQLSGLAAGSGASAGPPAGASALGKRPAIAGLAPQRERRRGRPGALDGAAGMVSRRMIGKALGAVAVGTVGAAGLAGMGSGSAEAADGDAIKAGQSTACESATELKFDGTSPPGMIFLVNDTTFSGGTSAHTAALGGWAGGDVANGVYGFTEVEASDGVVGQVGSGNTTGNGVHGLAADAGTVAVLGENSVGTAIAGTSDTALGNATAIIGTMTSTTPGSLSAAVRGVSNGTGRQGIGVWGSQAGNGWGVYGSVPHGIGVNADGGTGIGVQATGSTGVKARGTSGRGGAFSGPAAQVQLIPGSRSTHPANGRGGDLYADKNGRLWFCKKGGTTATWHQIA